MSTRVVISCDGTWDHGRMPCRGMFPARSDHRPTAVGEAWRAGWDWRTDVGDLCPAHARARGPAS